MTTRDAQAFASRRALVMIFILTIGVLVAVGTTFQEISYTIASITIVYALSDFIVDGVVLNEAQGIFHKKIWKYEMTLQRVPVAYVIYFLAILGGSLLSDFYTQLVVRIIQSIPNMSTSATPTSIGVSSLLAAVAVLADFRFRYLIQRKKSKKNES